MAKEKNRGFSLVLLILIISIALIGELFLFRKTASKSLDSEPKTTQPLDANGKPYILESTDFQKGNVITVEKYISLDTGGRSQPYSYWDAQKYVYHYNCFGASCVQQDYECSSPKDFISSVDNEYFKALSSPKKLSQYDDDQVDLWGSGFSLTLGDGRKVFLADTPLGLTSLCVMGETCLRSGVGFDKIPFPDIGYEKKENLIFFDGKALLNILKSTAAKQLNVYENCHPLTVNDQADRPLWSH